MKLMSLVNGYTQPARTSDEQYKLLFENTPQAMWVYDVETLRFLAVNEATINLYGYSREELLEMTVKDIHLPDDVDNLVEFPSEDSEKVESWKHRKKDGAVIDVETTCRALTFLGRPARLVIARDITRRRAEEETAKYLLDFLLENSPDNIYFKDADCRFIKVSKSVSDKFGFDNPAQMVGKSDFDFFSKECAQEFYLSDQEVIKSGRSLMNVEEKEMRSDGRETWASTTTIPLRDRRGRIIGIFGISKEITDLKLAEQELRRERDLLHTLMDNIPDLIYFKTAEGRFIRINKAQAQAMGITNPEDAVGGTDFDFFAVEYAKAAHEDEQRILSTGKPLVGKAELVTKRDSSSRWMLATKVPVKDKEGRVTGLVGISKDITEQKQAEEALNRSLAEFLDVVSSVSGGDLTKRGVEGDDTLGQIACGVNKMLENFGRMLIQVRQLGFTVSSSATEILSASEQIARGAQKQCDEITNTSSAVEEMAATMNQVSRNIEITNLAAQRALDMAEHGSTAVRDTSNAIMMIDSAVQQTADKMHLLARSSTEVSEILALISGIASQTNLLSLNAAIQAAHAGEAGLGFSVVAEEIRKLADKSAEATKDIGRVIRSIQMETTEALSAMETCMKEVREGRLLADQARQMLQDISSVVSQAAELIAEISAASEEQAKVSKDLATTVNTISDIALETSSGSHETAQVVQALVNVSDSLNKAISQFKIG